MIPGDKRHAAGNGAASRTLQRYKMQKGEKSTGKKSFALTWSPGIAADKHGFKGGTVDLIAWFKRIFKPDDKQKDNKSDTNSTNDKDISDR